MQTVRVIYPSVPIVTPEDIAGSHDPGDAAVAALIQAVTEQIDGPGGSLGRCLGPQVLRLTQGSFCGRNMLLPCGPVIAIDNVSYLDADEQEVFVDDASFRLVDDRLWFASGFAFPTVACTPDAIRIEYQAGYDGSTTGDVPERARQAIIATVQHLKATLATENLFLSAETVVGVGRLEYAVTEQAATVIRQMTDRLLSTLWKPIV